MPLPNTIETYEDIRLVMDNVLAQGGGSYVLPSQKEAVFWRKRAYKFRKLANAQGEKQYNAFVLRIPRPGVIVFDQHFATGVLLSPDGDPVDMTKTYIEDLDIGDIIE